MSVINPNETVGGWRAHKREAAVQLYLEGAAGNTADLLGARVAGFPLSLTLLPATDHIDVEDIAGAAAAIIHVDPERPQSIKRFEALATATRTPVIAAAYEPPLAFVRALVRAGAYDVVPLPLDIADLETSLNPIRDEIARRNQSMHAADGKLVSVIKGVGGVGATAVLTQLGVRLAQRQAGGDRDVCLLDLDLQFGNAAFQLGLHPSLTFADLVEAGERLDGELFRATTTAHPSGLKVLAAPPAMMPLDAVGSEQFLEMLSVAKREFGTLLVDLPANWTNWSLSVLAQSDLVILLTELSVPGLQRARRQLDLIRDQDLASVDLRLVVNRFESGLFRSIKPADVQGVVGRDIAYTIANDPNVIKPAIERGVPIGEIKRKSAIGKDIDALADGITAALGRSTD